MIVRDRLAAWEVFFVLRGSVVPRIAPQIAFVAALSVLIVWVQHAGWFRITPVAPVALSIIGAALSIFAAFRNSACYERWWEARKQLGKVVIEARSLVRQARSYIAVDPAADPCDDMARCIAMRCIAFVHLTRDLLRGKLPGEPGLRRLKDDERSTVQASTSPPNRLLEFISRDIAAAASAGRIGLPLAQVLEERVAGLADALTSLERTRATPMPFAYTLLVHRTAYLFCLLLPFGLSDLAGWWTPLLTAFVSYTFFGLDAMGDELGSPFELSANCLPMDAIARGLEINLLEAIGATPLPEPLQAEDYVLT